MDIILIGAVALVGTIVIGTVGIMVEVYALWWNAKFKKLERQVNGCFDIMEACLVNVDRETGLIWAYVLPKKEAPP